LPGPFSIYRTGVKGMARFHRVMVKLSGGALAGGSGFGFDRAALEHIVGEILSVRELGVEMAIMVGGGNIFRGNMADDWGIERAEADNIGATATVINSLMLRGALTARGAGDVRVMTAIPMNAVAEPYIRLRAIHHMEKGRLLIFAAGTGQPYITTDYPAVQRALETRCDVIFAAKNGAPGVCTADPNLEPTARRFTTLPYEEVLTRNLKVMDQAAFLLAKEYRLPLYVFDFAEKQAMRRICEGEDVGTLIADGLPVQFA
jgi:uridylate kinase